MTGPFRAIGAYTVLALCVGCASDSGDTMSSGRILVAHRGASAYAPEHTRAAYELAIEQGADYIEPDLQITSDGVLIALHDLSLERTTNVAEVFPDRFREEVIRGTMLVRRWYASEFTLAEIKQLDAGSWFDPRFAGERVPTFAEVIEIARGRAGIFPETKAPEVYGDQGFDMERLVQAELQRHGLDVPGGVPGTPVLLQSFSAESLRIMRQDLGIDLPSTFLMGTDTDERVWFTPEGFERIKEFATGIGPSKNVLVAFPDAVAKAHAAGLTVIPYTFGGGDADSFPTFQEEMWHFLYTFGADGLFTNNPDLFPRDES
ncbi:MAG: glycerophosphodiester phosphodiesterase family protein [Gemmatimonadota bacterium]|nr:glycerophosphodiester phosphodiesterase family protein [Gemmatimonadota bacterium]MDH3421626.1 glycerophosphodiester phosphodiesterase family protein [Gemmatimonadota bacterium]